MMTENGKLPPSLNEPRDFVHGQARAGSNIRPKHDVKRSDPAATKVSLRLSLSKAAADSVRSRLMLAKSGYCATPVFLVLPVVMSVRVRAAGVRIMFDYVSKPQGVRPHQDRFRVFSDHIFRYNFGFASAHGMCVTLSGEERRQAMRKANRPAVRHLRVQCADHGPDDISLRFGDASRIVTLPAAARPIRHSHADSFASAGHAARRRHHNRTQQCPAGADSGKIRRSSFTTAAPGRFARRETQNKPGGRGNEKLRGQIGRGACRRGRGR
nr:hypothetical protein [uncultured Rhodopila sp.]